MILKIALVSILVIIVVAILISLPFYFRDLSKIKDKLSQYDTHVITTPFGDIEYVRSGDGFPTILSHGIQGGFDQGLSLSKIYLGSGFNTIAVSRFGYFSSSLPKNPTPLLQAKTYVYLLDALSIDKAIIVGNSAGGSAAFQFAINYPERCVGLILLASSVPDYRPLPPKPIISIVFGSDYLYWLFAHVLKSSMLSMFISKSFKSRLSKEELDYYFAAVVIGSLPVSLRKRGAINDMYLSNRDINKGYEYSRIQVPTLMFHAKDDALPSFEETKRIAEQIPGIEFCSFDEGGHLFIDHQEFIRKKTEKFLNRIVERGGGHFP